MGEEYLSLLETLPPNTDLISPFTGQVIKKEIRIYLENGQIVRLKACFSLFMCMS